MVVTTAVLVYTVRKIIRVELEQEGASARKAEACLWDGDAAMSSSRI
jgi:hypothetical protein